MSTHILPIRVYYEDTDVGGIVYHPNYLKYFERARTEYLRAKGYDLVSLNSKNNLQFVIHTAKLEYLQPARLDQLLYVVSEVESVRPASLVFAQGIYVACRSELKPSLQTIEESAGGFLQAQRQEHETLPSSEHASVNEQAKSWFDPSDLCCKAEIRLACVDNQLRPTGLPMNLGMELKKCLQISR